MYLGVVGLFLAVVVGVYFAHNPMRHGRRFLVRRFVNWFPLGMTYAFLYMGRYNLNVAKNALGTLMSKQDFGLIFAAGTATYAFSFLVNGPLVDRIGGRKGILIAALGASAANAVLGVATYLVTARHVALHVVPVFSAVYAINMYFQSYGAVSIIKVKAYWFHVRERGTFGAIFGTLISIGVYLAFDWGQAIVDMSRVGSTAGPGWLRGLIAGVFAAGPGRGDAIWAVFFIPAAVLLFWAAVDAWLIKDAPEHAGFPPFDTHDASSGQMHLRHTSLDLLKKVFTSPLMLMIAVVEMTSGVFRNGVAQWYTIFAHETRLPGSTFYADHWGWLLCVFGIAGGFAGGMVSDAFFQSRRGPPAALLCGSAVVLAAAMAAFIGRSGHGVGLTGILIVTASIGVTSLMSGTAATDFGGRKATATASGIVDGFAYLGSAIQSVSLGYLTTWNWHAWPLFLIPFAAIGMFVAIRIWHALPAATRRYIDEVESKGAARAAAP